MDDDPDLEPHVIKELSFTYNDEGIRTSKTINGIVHEYTLDGSTVVSEKWTQSGIEHLLMYVYDENGSPVAIQYRNTRYLPDDYDVFFLEKNMFGDVIGIYNEDGEKIGSYVYDAWGNFQITCASTNTVLENDIVEYYNPFRYRGYFYDVDLNLYYLQSRYYMPEIGRFINADSAEIIAATPDGLTDKNLFAYCDNNPIMRTDEDGEFWHIVAGAVGGAIIGGAAKLLTNLIEDKDDVWDGVAVATLIGAASGALAATGVGLVGQVAGNAAIAMVGNATQQTVDYAQGERESLSFGEMLLDGAIGALGGMLGGTGASMGNTKTAMTLGRQVTKRVFIKHEVSKGLAYYGKNMMNGTGKSIFKELGKGLSKSGAGTFGINAIRSVYNRWCT